MRQARDSGWYTTEGGGEVFIAKGTVRPDSHPDVQAIPSLFDQLSDDSAAPAPRKGTGAARPKGASDE